MKRESIWWEGLTRVASAVRPERTTRTAPVDPGSFPALSVVIPSYNAKDLLRRSLTTLEKALPGQAEIVVMDGSSVDGSLEMVQREFPHVRAYSCKNHGFAHAVNRGIEKARGEQLLLLNSDLFVTREALVAMQQRLVEDAKTGAVAPVLLNEDGSKQHLFGAFGAFYWANWRTVRETSKVPLLSFACVMTRRDVVRQVGGFDETFFLYNEEYDWCVRAQNAGYRMELVPEPVIHIGQGSTTPSPELMLEAHRGFLYFVDKHAPKSVAEFLRRAMQFEGYCYSRIDPRPGHRVNWARLEQLTREANYAASPFPLSGRGTTPARPNWSGLDEALQDVIQAE